MTILLTSNNSLNKCSVAATLLELDRDVVESPTKIIKELEQMETEYTSSGYNYAHLFPPRPHPKASSRLAQQRENKMRQGNRKARIRARRTKK